MRVSASIRPDILELLTSLEDDIDAQIRKGKTEIDIRPAGGLAEADRATIATAYRDADKVLAGELPAVLEASAENAANNVNSLVGVHLMKCRIHRGPVREPRERDLHQRSVCQRLVGRSKGQTWSHRFGMQMRLGMLQGESIDQLVRRVRGTQANAYRDGIMQSSKDQAEILVRTSVIAVGTEAT